MVSSVIFIHSDVILTVRFYSGSA